jgi:hypothetical protein
VKSKLKILAGMTLFFVIAMFLLNIAKVGGAQDALAERGLLKIETQQQPVVPCHPDVQFTVADHPTALTCDISLAILTGSDSSSVNALVSSCIRQGDRMMLFQFADLDAKMRVRAYALIAEPVSEVGNQAPFNHVID